MSQRRIILLIESSSAYGRRCLLGITRYARLHGHWQFWHKPHWLVTPRVVEHLKQWRGTGIISRLEDPRMVKAIQRLNLPTVELRGAILVPGVPCITSDATEVVQMAIDHLQSKGYQHLAFCGVPGMDYSDAREGAFRRLQDAAGRQVLVFSPRRRSRRLQLDTIDQINSPQPLMLERWLQTLPRPVGIIACNDRRGGQVLEACTAVALRVPYDVGVVGVDNDEVICELADPPLTSVVANAEAAGYKAARLLDQLIAGNAVDAADYTVPPKSVQLRSSTDTTAVQDRELASIIRYLEMHIQNGVNVADLTEQTSLSRSSLERRFREYLNCTPREYLLRRRIDRVKELLQDPNLTVADVASRCGFKNASHMIALFRAQTGQTPAEHRRGTV
ncbi:MAG: DNA-binding transcriptional regulator [Phycisphaeraceae bacterium]